VLLKVEGLEVTLSGVPILRNIDIEIAAGEIVGLIGPNGAGKSTLLGAIMGLYVIQNGLIRLNGREIHRMRTEEISKLISLTPQEEGVIPFLTVIENLWVAKKGAKNEILNEEVLKIFPMLSEKIDQEASTLSGGQRQALAIAISLIRNKSLILLDEPTIGLSPIMVNTILDTIQRIKNKFGLSIFIAEQTPRILDICDRVYVLEGGEIRIQGPANKLKCDDRICKVYLGMAV
jgi:branched-chain amino acid transport system ATP-binding protein